MIPFPNKKYQIIYADPPWKFKYYGKSDDRYRRAEGHYKVMELKNIMQLPIKEIANDNSILFLWVLNSMLQEGLNVIKEWGFTFKTIAFIWAKLNPSGINFHFGMGYWTRQNPELCLLGTRGKPKRIGTNITCLTIEPRKKHSEKPTVIREKIVKLMGDLPRIELFARQKIKGWDCWGDEIKCQN